MIWLMRLSRWVRRPPSRRQQILVAIVLGICATLYAVEYFIGWPDWAEVERIRRGPMWR